MRPFFREVKHYPSSNPQVSARHLAAVLQLRVIEDMRQLSAGLAQIDGITVYPTGANFVCFRIDMGMTARDLQRRLLVEHGMYVRDCSNKVGMDRFHIRVATQGRAQDQRLIDVLPLALAEAANKAG